MVVFGLRLKVKKTEYLTTSINRSNFFKIDGNEIARASLLKHLGSAMGMTV